MAEIRLSQEFSREFEKLKTKAKDGEGDAEYLLKIINRGIYKIAEDYKNGQKIQKSLWPDFYVKRYGINNMWRLRLDNFWRMIYTVMGEQIRIVAVLLDVLDHKNYERKFGYS